MKNILPFALGLWGAVVLFQCQAPSQEKFSPEEEKIYLSRGKQITEVSFAVLSKALSEAIAQKGVSGAVDYCHLKAFPLMDSLAEAHRVILKRVSQKARNPVDAPDSLEKVLLEAYASQKVRGEDLRPQLARLPGGKVLFTAPILLKPMCLNCHGLPQKDIAPATLARIQQKYPQDLATGYRIGDLRGMWAITFFEKPR
ncbi:MAG: DUF3365 domain-containing protein [Microscillaceae bacterium]|nr:DUF3365 domain-containing protein [Microscillaceae bacterium]